MFNIFQDVTDVKEFLTGYVPVQVEEE